MHDTVYVTSNPQLYQNRELIQPALHASINVWDEPGWNEEHGTVLPETVVDHAQRAAQEYSNKRLVVHFMQPHYPFIDSDTTFDKGHMNGDKAENVWGQLIKGELIVDEDTLWKIYADNLDRALPHVKELMKELKGRTVVTADHGNMVGERSFPIPIREWGHPRGIYTEQLVRVPWLIHDNEPRRDIVAERPETTTKNIEEGKVADRLKNLGYAE
ncbi:hypothetical protein [Saliphagus infecundisoli]|uniref:Uncharacterized protein n=1 Tax=Saliphagus infecundisoli TaxID=1849069 RepID=A0ABD5QIV4_9EURY